MRIDLSPYIVGNMFTGIKLGEDARLELDLDSMDKNDDEVILEIPSNTVSFNPSFFIGLLSESIEFLGEVKFFEKYTFDQSLIEDVFLDIIIDDFSEGFRMSLESIKIKKDVK